MESSPKTCLIEPNANHIGSHNGGHKVCDYSACDGSNQLRHVLYEVKNKVMSHQIDAVQVKNTLKSLHRKSRKVNVKYRPVMLLKSTFTQSIFGMFFIISAIIYQNWDDFFTHRCAIANNYIIMEVTRPVTNCSICQNVDNFLILDSPSKEVFAKYAYSGHPMVVRGATNNWRALHTFSFDFFRKLYTEIADAYESVEDECQFFPFKTEFVSLREVFAMPDERVNMSDSDSKPWYIGWSNCNPDVAHILRQHYQRPHFLPDDSESSAIDWIFMGYSEQGASMHLDYVQRPSWQAQIYGTKTWHLLPPPECENQCKAINITVRKGDIILIDTNQWYHDTRIESGEMSITIGSEYD